MTRRLIGAGLLVGIASTMVIVPNAAAQDESRITLTVGLIQDLDSPNVTAGYLVSSFELWNLQYATLTDKAAEDFATIPGLAESWEASEDGLTYTYTLREGLLWSDGEPLTAEDIAWTINTSRDQEWINHWATTVNLDATAIDDRTVQIVTSIPDPKLPTMDVYILPKHIWEPVSEGEIDTYDALDGVGSGPFTLTEWRAGQSWSMVANPNYWGGAPVIDQVVFRIFTNPDAMVAALQEGEIDAAHLVPSGSFEELDADPDIVAVDGRQGGFTELAMNGMAGGIGDGHPALQDLNVRHAIAHAIDREVMFDRIVLGLGERGVGLSVSADPVWKPDIPTDEQYNYDPVEATRLLDEGGYVDTNGDGTREMPGGGQELVFRYAERSESEQGPAIRDFVTGFLAEVGIGTEVSVFDDTQLTDVIASGEYDLFSWGWTPFVDPDPMLSYFTCGQVTTDIESVGYNDANWCDERYDALYEEQKVELDRDERIDIVHEMLRLFYDESTYIVLYEDADTQAYRTDRFEGWVQQPSDIGPVLFTNSSPSYVNLTPIEGGGGDGGGLSTGVLIALIAAGIIVIGGGVLLVVRNRTSRDDRE